MLLQEYKSELFADYYQFYLQDESVSGNLSDAWGEEAVERLLALEEGTLGVGTVRNMDVEVVVKVFSDDPGILASDSIHQINECDLEMKTNKLVIAGCTDYFPDAKRLMLVPGNYRTRIYYLDLDKISKDGLDGEDSYIIHLWLSGDPKELQVVLNRNWIN